MKHIVTLTRAGLEDLVKAFDRSAPNHLYKRRERVFKHGKLTWRYYYEDDDQRSRNRKLVEGEHREKVEHYLMADLAALYDSHKKELPPTSQWTTERLSQQLVTRPKVTVSAGYSAKHKKPSLEAEKHGLTPDRNVTQRIAMALGMIPERVQKLADIRAVDLLDSKDPQLLERAKLTGRPVPACFMEHLPGGGHRLVVVADEGAAGINTAPHGDPHFGSALTLTEERIWHQVAKAMLANADRDRHLKATLAEFKAISDQVSLSDQKVSGFAERSWEDDFAESFACMMSHPKQLATQAPNRYTWFQERKLSNASLPKEAEILDKPAADFAWYEAKKQSRTKQVLNKLKQEPPKDIPYRSEKDQFYTMTVDGRSIYFRIGPPDATSEPGWERMPETIDSKSGLPKYDSRVSNAFRGMDQYKEIYDDHGNRLDPVSAFFYLQQGQLDPKWEAKLPSDVPEDPADLRKFALHSSRDWQLGRKIFNSTGENRAHTAAERSKEEKAVAGYIKNGQLDEKRGKRWEWIPHPVSREEFHASTPTFAFDGLREAKEQPHFIPGQMDHDARGREVPKLWARVYELETAAGAAIRMTVQENPAFEVGQQIHAPVLVESMSEDGELTRKVEWRDVKLTIANPGVDPGYDANTGALTVLSLDPKDISKQLECSQLELLKRNGKFRQHQLHDPVLAALINPNNHPIRTSADLLSLIREAAKSKNEAWTSIHFDSEVPPHAVHAKVQFDGGGSPLLIGDYWKRKLGMENPRISDLISAGGKLKMEKPKLRKPRRPKIKIGDVVRFVVNGKELFGHLLERSVEGKRSYKIAPLSGQESPPGWDRMPESVTVGRAMSVPTDRDPKRPDIRKRQYVTPEHELLLFADDVQSATTTRLVRGRRVRADIIVPGSGVVKIALPKDGSWTQEEIARAPGVSVNPKGELFLDVRLIDRFREHVGGFVMDDHVQRKLRMLMEVSKAEGGARPHKVGIDEIADSLNGNKVRANGLLKGCREFIGDNPFALGKHQVELLQAMADNDGRILAAHFMGTGKTISAIAGIKMMQNLTLPDGSPHPNRPKRTLIVVPKSTATNWEDEVAKFTYGKATVIGSDAIKMFSPPKNLQRKVVGGDVESWEDFYERTNWTKETHEAKVEALRQEALKTDGRLWQPDKDHTDIVVVSQEYFTLHSDELKRLGGFDGMVVDEAHGVQRKNRRSEQIMKSWNDDMKMMMFLTGTPITNRLNTLPRYIEILSKGKVLLGGEGTELEKQENFENWGMVESAVMKQSNHASSVKMDINPQTSGRLIELVKPFIHVATSGDVVDKTMPAVLLDENSPIPQGEIQAALYRGHMGQLLESDRKLFELSATLGEDENIMSEDARNSVNAARMITNTLGYKSPDGREFITVTIPDLAAYRRRVREVRKEAKDRGRDPQEAADKVDQSRFTKKLDYRLPTFAAVKKAGDGSWPDEEGLSYLFKHPQERAEFKTWVGYMFGKEYDRHLAGKSMGSSLTPEQSKALKAGKPLNGIEFGKKVPNPNYGPEGVICRGTFNPKTQSAEPIVHKIRDASGKVVDTVVVPVGLRFIRDPRKKSAGIYFTGGLPVDHPDRGKFTNDWDYSQAVVDDARTDGTVRGAERGQRPKKGYEQHDVNRNPARRKERLMFDLAMTTENAKTDQLARDMAQAFDPAMGGNPDKQMIVFAQSIGSGVRCVESKLRMMGYQDVNEALAGSSDALVPPNGKYYVTYLNSEGTLGDRNLNSEIFRKRKEADGSDSDMSMFVHRSLHGVTGKIKTGEPSEGWPRKHRDAIKAAFGITMPARVLQDPETGKFKYFYEQDLTAGQKKRFAILDVAILTSRGAAKQEAKAHMKAFLEGHWSSRPPLDEKQVHVFNNCQMMVASDAAQVGLNWGNATDLIMYDSLFSPMEEWQRITRAARMLPPAVRDEFKVHFDKLAKTISEMENESGLQEFDGEVGGAMSIVEAALDKIPDIRDALSQQGMNPEAASEAFLAQRALDRIRRMRPEVSQRLRTQGRVLINAPKIPAATKEVDPGGVAVPLDGETQVVQKHEITEADITNEILEGKDPSGKPYLSAFEKQILRSRKYMVNVRRLTTSVVTPVLEQVKRKVQDPETGRMKTVKFDFVVGEQTEFPSKAEKSKLLRARAKQVPLESFLSDLQSELPTHTSYDYEAVSPRQLAKFNVGPKKTKAELAAMEARKQETKKFYGTDKTGLTLRQREQLERRRLAKERKAADKERKAAIRKQRAAEARARAQKKRIKKSLPLGYIL